MEENQNQSQETTQGSSQEQSSRVSFPTVGEPKKSGGAKTLLIIGILILIGVLGYVIYRSAAGKNEEASLTEPTPFENSAAGQEEVSPTPSATSSPSATVNKAKVKIQVQNGTGITGEAAYLENILKGMGYTNISVGNATAQNSTDTQVSFASSLSGDVVSEITTKLESIYQSVKTINSTSTSFDVIIITGLRKGATAKPTSSPSPSPKASLTPTPSATP